MQLSQACGACAVVTYTLHLSLDGYLALLILCYVQPSRVLLGNALLSGLMLRFYRQLTTGATSKRIS